MRQKNTKKRVGPPHFVRRTSRRDAVRGVGVHIQGRGKGLGKELVKAAIAVAVAQGNSHLYLWTPHPELEDKLYAPAGFAVAERLCFRGHDISIMKAGI